MKALIVGHKGLIGKAVYARLEQDGFDVVGADLPEHDFSVAVNMISYIKKARPDIVVNCAYPKEFYKHFTCFLETASFSAYYLSGRNGGTVISLSSIYGMVGPQDDLYGGTEMSMPDWYAFVKGGIIAHTKCLASRFGPKVRVNCISPGGVFDQQPIEFTGRYVMRTPLNRMATPDDIAGAVSFLCSDDASYITGHNLVVDGGWVCR